MTVVARLQLEEYFKRDLVFDLAVADCAALLAHFEPAQFLNSLLCAFDCDLDSLAEAFIRRSRDGDAFENIVCHCSPLLKIELDLYSLPVRHRFAILSGRLKLQLIGGANRLLG